MAESTGAIQCVRLALHANQNREIGKQKAAAIDIGSRASGDTWWVFCSYFFSKYSLDVSRGQREGLCIHSPVPEGVTDIADDRSDQESREG